MPDLITYEPVDYLAIGHVAIDITPEGDKLGGTVAYAALTAKALGLKIGIVTSAGKDAPLQALDGIQIVQIPSEYSTTFKNIKTESGRKQTLHHQAEILKLEHIPPAWQGASIIHLAPIANEVDMNMIDHLTGSMLCVTPQGWMRRWDDNGQVTTEAWENSNQVLSQARAVVMSAEDVNFNLELIEAMSHQTRVFCLTEGEAGSVMYWHGDRRRFRPPKVNEVDATGAGDIFAAALFIRLFNTRDPWEAARFATNLAAHSVTRSGMNGIPNSQEIDDSLMEVLT